MLCRAYFIIRGAVFEEFDKLNSIFASGIGLISYYVFVTN